MSGTDTTTLRLDEALELADLLRPAWPAISAGIRASGVPVCEGDDGGGDDGDDSSGKDENDGNDGDKGKTPEQLQAEIDKWKGLARKHEGNAKKNAEAARRVAELEDADKTELQRATDKATDADKRATAAEAKLTRLEVALEKAPDGMPLAKVRKLAGRLTGENREDLETDAEELFADFTPGTGDEGDEGDGKPSGDDTRRRPQERLRPGASSSGEPEETDPDKLAASVPRMY